MFGGLGETPLTQSFLQIFIDTERLKCMEWQVWVSAQLWDDPRHSYKDGASCEEKRTIAVTSVLPLTAELQMVR